MLGAVVGLLVVVYTIRSTFQEAILPTELNSILLKQCINGLQIILLAVNFDFAWDVVVKVIEVSTWPVSIGTVGIDCMLENPNDAFELRLQVCHINCLTHYS